MNTKIVPEGEKPVTLRSVVDAVFPSWLPRFVKSALAMAFIRKLAEIGLPKVKEWLTKVKTAGYSSQPMTLPMSKVIPTLASMSQDYHSKGDLLYASFIDDALVHIAHSQITGGFIDNLPAALFHRTLFGSKGLYVDYGNRPRKKFAAEDEELGLDKEDLENLTEIEPEVELDHATATDLSKENVSITAWSSASRMWQNTWNRALHHTELGSGYVKSIAAILTKVMKTTSTHGFTVGRVSFEVIGSVAAKAGYYVVPFEYVVSGFRGEHTSRDAALHIVELDNMEVNVVKQQQKAKEELVELIKKEDEETNVPTGRIKPTTIIEDDTTEDTAPVGRRPAKPGVRPSVVRRPGLEPVHKVPEPVHHTPVVHHSPAHTEDEDNDAPVMSGRIKSKRRTASLGTGVVEKAFNKITQSAHNSTKFRLINKSLGVYEKFLPGMTGRVLKYFPVTVRLTPDKAGKQLKVAMCFLISRRAAASLAGLKTPKGGQLNVAPPNDPEVMKSLSKIAHGWLLNGVLFKPGVKADLINSAREVLMACKSSWGNSAKIVNAPDGLMVMIDASRAHTRWSKFIDMDPGLTYRRETMNRLIDTIYAIEDRMYERAEARRLEAREDDEPGKAFDYIIKTIGVEGLVSRLEEAGFDSVTEVMVGTWARLRSKSKNALPKWGPDIEDAITTLARNMRGFKTTDVSTPAKAFKYLLSNGVGTGTLTEMINESVSDNPKKRVSIKIVESWKSMLDKLSENVESLKVWDQDLRARLITWAGELADKHKSTAINTMDDNSSDEQPTSAFEENIAILDSAIEKISAKLDKMKNSLEAQLASKSRDSDYVYVLIHEIHSLETMLSGLKGPVTKTLEETRGLEEAQRSLKEVRMTIEPPAIKKGALGDLIRTVKNDIHQVAVHFPESGGQMGRIAPNSARNFIEREFSIKVGLVRSFSKSTLTPAVLTISLEAK